MSIKKILLFSFFVALFFVGNISLVWAADNQFTLNLPEFAQATSPADLVVRIYLYALSIAGGLAVVMIVFYGIKYAVSAGNAAALSDALDAIKSAVWGIALLAGAYLILNTINPDLTILKNPDLKGLQAIPADGGGPGQSGPSGCSGVNCLTHEQALGEIRSFSDGNITLSSTGNCSDPNNPNCTSLQGFPSAGIDKLREFYNGCQHCQIVITAGTEDGHQTHGQGRAVVDMRFSSEVDNYIYSVIGNSDPSLNTYYDGSDGNKYFKEGDHWHVEFG